MKVRLVGVFTVLAAIVVGLLSNSLVSAQESPFQERPMQESPAQGANESLVSVVHASPDAPAVDVYLDQTLILSNLAFFSASDYLSVTPGTYLVDVVPAGGALADAVISTEVTASPGVAYSIVALDTVANIRATVFIDDLSPTAPGDARIAVDHLSPDAPAVDVILADGTPLATDLTFGTGAEFTVPAGTYDILVVAAGTDTVVADLSGTSFEAGNYYNVFAVGLLNPADASQGFRTELFVTNVGVVSAPAPTPTALPVQLPETSSTETVPFGALALIAVSLIALGGALLFGLRRRTLR